MVGLRRKGSIGRADGRAVRWACIRGTADGTGALWIPVCCESRRCDCTGRFGAAGARSSADGTTGTGTACAGPLEQGQPEEGLEEEQLRVHAAFGRLEVRDVARSTWDSCKTSLQNIDLSEYTNLSSATCAVLHLA